MDLETRVEALEAHCRVVEDAIRQLAVTTEVQARLIGHLLLHNQEAAGRLQLLMERELLLPTTASDEMIAGFEHFYQAVKPSLDARRALEEEAA